MSAVAREPPVRGLVALFASTIFCSAFLLFQVQPLVSKSILPWFGGSPAVWTTAMLFFQSVLFAAYVYAHLLGRLRSARAQSAIHLVLLAAATVAAARVLPEASLEPDGEDAPGARVLLILAASVGLPYFCLATTGPLVQLWFARAGLGASVFRLYALSNLGSFLALLSFPYLFEPWLELPSLGRLWTVAYWAFAVQCAAVTVVAARRGSVRPARSAALEPGALEPGGRVPDAGAPGAQGGSRIPTDRMRRAAWVLLPALASLAFVATTDHASHDVAPEPRLWIATLGLYLLSLVIAFDHTRWYRPAGTAIACLVSILLLAGYRDLPERLGWDWEVGVAELRILHYAALFAICLLCHGELVRRRPADTRELTAFYLWMAFGGACGGLFVARVATPLFDDYHEWPAMLVAAALLAAAVLAREARRALGRAPAAVAASAGAACAAAVLYWAGAFGDHDGDPNGIVHTGLEQSRSFYGTVSVVERRDPADPRNDHRVFFSGRITHGVQYLHPQLRHVPTTYYATDSGIGETLGYLAARQPSARVALIGLGAGTLAGYARDTDAYDVFEINPDAVRIARRWFDNLERCRARELRVILGDARLRIARLPEDVKYDAIVLDAFSGGSVPVHLLTREAFAAYERHLAPDGFIAINITNAWLNLYPVVRAQAQALGMGWRNRHQPPDPARQVRRNQHFVMTRDATYLSRFPSVNRIVVGADGISREQQLDLPDIPLWTDRFSSVGAIAWRD
jgi:SAM-dependent methyltransferase